MTNLEILPLGGAGEIGRNCTAVIQGDDIIVVDCGISFPHEEQLGVDIVIPDFSFLIENKDKIRGIFLTHAHEDHVGALSWLLKDIKVPVYGTELTHAMIRQKLDERLDIRTLILREVQLGEVTKAGAFEVELIHVTHSIPDSSAISIKTEHGYVLFTGDFKLDFTPVDGRLTQIQRLTEIGREGVVVLLSDCTNIERKGWGRSERMVAQGFRKVFTEAPGRILITTFASNIHRMQQALDIAAETGRKVAVAGRRMEQTLEICSKLGHVRIPKGVRIALEDIDNYEPHELVILTTGSQGEPRSALVQMSKGEYSRMKIREGDRIIYSARAIPGNEAPIWRTLNRIFNLGAVVVYDQDPPVHVSGHGHQEELKLMINLLRPFYLAPVHGEPRHQHLYLEMSRFMGHPEHRMFQLHDGMKLVLNETTAWTEEFCSAEPKLLDSSGKFFVSNAVLQERTSMANFGMVIIELKVNAKGAHLEDPPLLTAKGFSADEDVLRRVQTTIGANLDKLSPSEWRDKETVRSIAMDAARVTLQRSASNRALLHCSIHYVN